MFCVWRAQLNSTRIQRRLITRIMTMIDTTVTINPENRKVGKYIEKIEIL